MRKSCILYFLLADKLIHAGYCMVLETLNTGSRCARCGKNSMLTDNATGERFCGICGFVIYERIEESGPE